MEFPRISPRRRAEGFVPMINIVFLLLIFFLMTATLQAPEPFPVTPPIAEGATPSGGDEVLFVSADGTLAFGEVRGDAVFARLAAVEGALRLRADATLPADRLVGLIARLNAIGVTEIELVAVTQ